MVSIISFDLDGTIMQQCFADSVWLIGLPAIYAKQKNISFETAQTFLMQCYDTIGNEKREWYDLSYWISALNLSINAKDLLYLYKDSIKPFSEAPKVIQNLSKTYNLIICSGAMKEFIQIQLESTNLIKYFSHLFSSISDYSMVKKDLNYYLSVAKKLNIKPNEIVHIGDNEIFDYYTPKEAGLHAFYLCRNKNISAPHIVHNLNEVEVRLNSLIE